MVMELIQGEGGYYPGNKEFFDAIISVLKKHNIAIVVDEIQTFGRVPEVFAFKHFDLETDIDIVTVGKLSQVCATLFNKNFSPKPGLISQTFTGASTSIFASKLILQKLFSDEFYGETGKIKLLSDYLEESFRYLTSKYPHIVKGPYGHGLMRAMTVFDGDFNKTWEFAKLLFEKGVVCFIAGSKVTRLRFLVPVGSVTIDDIDNVINIIDDSLKNI